MRQTFPNTFTPSLSSISTKWLRETRLAALPVYFTAPTQSEARQKAAKHWQDILDKKANEKPRGRKPKDSGPGNQQPSAPVEIDDVI